MIWAFLGGAASRFAVWGVALALWLFTRPGGWAVVAVAVLVGLKLLPAK